MGELKLKKLLKAEQVADILGVDIQFIWAGARNGSIPKVPKLGKLVRFDPSVIENHFKIKLTEK